jgi:hypothetical protein
MMTLLTSIMPVSKINGLLKTQKNFAVNSWLTTLLVHLLGEVHLLGGVHLMREVHLLRKAGHPHQLQVLLYINGAEQKQCSF